MVGLGLRAAARRVAQRGERQGEQDGVADQRLEVDLVAVEQVGLALGRVALEHLADLGDGLAPNLAQAAAALPDPRRPHRAGGDDRAPGRLEHELGPHRLPRRHAADEDRARSASSPSTVDGVLDAGVGQEVGHRHHERAAPATITAPPGGCATHRRSARWRSLRPCARSRFVLVEERAPPRHHRRAARPAPHRRWRSPRPWSFDRPAPTVFIVRSSTISKLASFWSQ